MIYTNGQDLPQDVSERLKEAIANNAVSVMMDSETFAPYITFEGYNLLMIPQEGTV